MWPIQAFARHSTSTILKYTEETYIVTLSSMAAETAAGRTIAHLQAELQALRAEVTPAKRSIPSPVAPAAPAPVQEFVVSTRAGGKAHRLSIADPGLTQCGWAWRRFSQVTPTSDIEDAQRCSKSFGAELILSSSSSKASSSEEGN